MVAVTTIKDPRINVKMTPELVDILKKYAAHIREIPENIFTSLKVAGVCLSTDDIVSNDVRDLKATSTDIEFLNDILNRNFNKVKLDDKSPPNKKENSDNAEKHTKKSTEVCLFLNDLRWLNHFLKSLRADNIVDVHLNDLLESCDLQLPKNEKIKRNPQLEARCQKLRGEQQNREYRNMTKNVDATLKHYPEDSVAYQMRTINNQIIAVLQFIFSVSAGFLFGFLGIDLIIGELDFGLRLLLGVMVALIVALAEIYFLAKKLHEYDAIEATANKAISKTIPVKVNEEAGVKAHEE